MIPEEVPQELVALGIPLHDADDEEIAWPREPAVEIIHSLEGSKVAVISVEIYRSQAWGLVPTDENWCCETLPGETATDFAHRSRTAALAYIEAREENEQEFYALEFSDQQLAA
jgi:hypothetical protein